MKKKIPIEEMLVGGRLARDLFDSRNNLLLKEGTLVTREFIMSLQTKGIQHVYLDAPDDQRPDKAELERLKQKQTLAQSYAKHHQLMTHEIKRTYLRGKYQKTMQRELFEGLVELLKILHPVADHELLPLYFQARNFTREKGYTYVNHATNTGILCAILSRWLGLNQDETVAAAMTGYLHDIGKSRIPATVLEKPGPLNSEESRLVKTHPILGASILTKTAWLKPSVIIGVLRHHERLDGSGYPYGVMGSDIPLCARIAAVAGAFDTMISDRPYAPAVDLFAAIAHLRDQSFGQLDALITRTLYNRILYSYQGRKVELLNGESGTIICQGQEREIRTFVQTEKGTYLLNGLSAPVIKRILE